MNKFDKYTHNYKEIVNDSLPIKGVDMDFFTRGKVAHFLNICKKDISAGLEQLKVLDIGCGVGITDSYLESFFCELHGVDISSGCLEQAVLKNPKTKYLHYNGNKLPYEDCEFDVCFTICVLHHVSQLYWKNFCIEMLRVLKPGGIAVIMEHNPFNPLTLLTVKRCPLDQGVTLLSKKKLIRLVDDIGQIVNHEYILFFPWEGVLTRKVEKLLRKVPLGAQHSLTVRKES